jgi:hypothetical protein
METLYASSCRIPAGLHFKECIWHWCPRTVLAPLLLRALYDPVKQMPRETWYGSVLKQPVQPIQFSFTSGTFYHHFQWCPTCVSVRTIVRFRTVFESCLVKAPFPPCSGHFSFDNKIVHFIVSITRDITEIYAPDRLPSLQTNDIVKIQQKLRTDWAMLLGFVYARTCRNGYATCTVCVTSLKLNCVQHILRSNHRLLRDKLNVCVLQHA